MSHRQHPLASAPSRHVGCSMVVLASTGQRVIPGLLTCTATACKLRPSGKHEVLLESKILTQFWEELMKASLAK